MLRGTWPCGHTFRPKVWPSKSFSTKAQRSTFWNTITMPIVEVQPQDSDSCVPRHVSYLLHIIVRIRGILSWSASILCFFSKKGKFWCLTVHSCSSHSSGHHVTGSSHGIKFGHQHGQPENNKKSKLLHPVTDKRVTHLCKAGRCKPPIYNFSMVDGTKIKNIKV